LQVTWKNETTHEILRVASSYRVGCLEQLNHSQNPFHVLFFIGQVAWKNETTREILRDSSSYRAGHLEQLDHSRNSFHVLFFIGRSPRKMRPLAKSFALLFPVRQVAWNN
jgi:citrate synthase